jgi:hypothetical protein
MATLFAVAMVLAGVMKLFQIHNTLTEIKDALQNGARPVAAVAPVTMPVAAPVQQPVYAPMGPVVAKAAPAPAAAAQAPVAHAELYAMGSGEAMLRALDLQMKAEEGEALTPEVVDPSQRR